MTEIILARLAGHPCRKESRLAWPSKFYDEQKKNYSIEKKVMRTRFYEVEEKKSVGRCSKKFHHSIHNFSIYNFLPVYYLVINSKFPNNLPQNYHKNPNNKSNQIYFDKTF